MTAMMETRIYIEIDEKIEALIEEINASPPQPSADLAERLRGVVVDAILGPFGLSGTVFADRDGGNITTVHNFDKGVTANAEDAVRYDGYVKANTTTFDRSDYERPLPDERKKIFTNTAEIHDAYTGEKLPKDGRAHRDHVVSAAEIERSASGHLAQSRAERVETANLDANKVWTDASLNTSKNDRDLMEWAAAPNRNDPSKTNADYYGASEDLMRKRYEEARGAVDRVQNLAVLKKQAGEFVVRGGLEAGKLAFRQVLGLLLKELASSLIDEIRSAMRRSYENLRDLADRLGKRLAMVIENLKARWAEFLKEGAAAGLTGFLSTLITLLINSVVTTARHIVTIIREGTLAVMRSIKLIVAPPADMSAGQIGVEVLSLLAGALTTAVGLAMQEALAKALATVPLLTPFADDIAGVATAILSGTAGLLVVLLFDRIKMQLAFERKQIADLHRGQAVALLTIRKTLFAIDEAKALMDERAIRLHVTTNADRVEMHNSANETAGEIAEYAASVANLSNLLKQV